MSKIAIATCNQKPDYQPSDAVLAARLAALGHDVAPAPWNGDQAPFAAADLAVVRSTWDYMHAPQPFAAWLATLDPARTLNDPALMKWNLSKRYLLTLATAGAPLPPTRFVSAAAPDLAAALDALGLSAGVAKPVISGGGIGLSVIRRDDAAGLEAAAAALKGAGIVQPLIEEIRDPGETSLVFFDGEFSHAVLKTPPNGQILCQAEHGGRYRVIDPPGWAVDEGARILSLLPAPAAYARVDVIILDARLLLMEVEVIEPELFFDHVGAAADRFAALIDERLG